MAKAVKKKKELTLEEKLAEALVPVEEQPYKVPENWCWVRLKNLSEPICDGVHFAPSYIESGIPCYSAKDIYSDEIHNDKCFYITRSDYEDMKNKINVKQNSILVTKSGSIGRSAVVDDYYEFGLVESIGVINVLQGKPYYIKRLLDYGFVYSNTYLEQYTTGTTIKHLTLRLIEKILVPLPPLPEQQRIVDRIESLFAKLDEAKEKAQAVVDGFEDRKAAILHKAFTGELTAQWRREHRKSDHEWRTVRFDEAAEIKSNLVNPTEYLDFPHIAPDNIEKKTGILLEYHSIKEDGVKSGKHRFYAGQILYSKIRPYLSKVVVVDFDGLCSADMYPINAKGNTKFLWYYMLSNEFLDQASNSGSRSVLPKINQKELSRISVRITSLEEQKKVVDILDNTFKQEQQAKDAAEAVISQIDTMKKSILARAFRGELGTNDPAEESAVELLKQVL